MTEEPATRAPQAPQATQTPAPARGEGPGSDRPPQGHTALRDRIASAIGSTMILRTSVDEIAEAVMEVVHPHLKSLVDAPKEVGDSGDLSERLDAALRTVGLARNLAAYRDAVLPVIADEVAGAVLHTTLFGWRPRAQKAEAAVQRAEALAERWENALATDLRYARALRAALDADQPKETT